MQLFDFQSQSVGRISQVKHFYRLNAAGTVWLQAEPVFYERPVSGAKVPDDEHAACGIPSDSTVFPADAGGAVFKLNSPDWEPAKSNGRCG